MTEMDLGRSENSLTTVSLGQGTHAIFNWTTLVGQPEFNELRNGVYDVHIHIFKTGTKPVTITPKLYNISADGSSRNLLLTFESAPITDSALPYDLHGVLTETFMLPDGERLNLELEAEVGATGNNPTITIEMEGTTDSHMSIETSTNAFEKIFIRRDGTNTLTGNWQYDTPANPFNFNGSGGFTTTGTIIGGTVTANTINAVNEANIADLFIGEDDLIISNTNALRLAGGNDQVNFESNDLDGINKLTVGTGISVMELTSSGITTTSTGTLTITAGGKNVVVDNNLTIPSDPNKYLKVGAIQMRTNEISSTNKIINFLSGTNITMGGHTDIIDLEISVFDADTGEIGTLTVGTLSGDTDVIQVMDRILTFSDIDIFGNANLSIIGNLNVISGFLTVNTSIANAITLLTDDDSGGIRLHMEEDADQPTGRAWELIATGVNTYKLRDINNNADRWFVDTDGDLNVVTGNDIIVASGRYILGKDLSPTTGRICMGNVGQACTDSYIGYTGTSVQVNIAGSGVFEVRNSSGATLGTVLAGSFQTSTPKTLNYQGNLLDSLTSPSNILGVDGKLARESLLGEEAGVLIMSDDDNCWEELDTIEYCYLINNTQGDENCYNSSIKDWNSNKEYKSYISERIQENYVRECGTKPMNVTKIEELSHYNRLLISELLERVEWLENNCVLK